MRQPPYLRRKNYKIDALATNQNQIIYIDLSGPNIFYLRKMIKVVEILK